MKRVVIADDSSMARAFIIKCLHVAGYHDAEIAEAKNGQEALEFLREKPADLLITDLNMPVLDGLQLVRRVSASRRMVMFESGSNSRVRMATSMLLSIRSR